MLVRLYSGKAFLYHLYTAPSRVYQQVPADWSQQTTVLSDEIIQAYPNGFDAAYVNSCEEAAYVAAWNIRPKRQLFRTFNPALCF